MTPAATAKKTIYERMGAILAEMPSVGKDQTNQQQGYKFRGQEDVMNHLSPLLGRHGVFIVPDVIERVESEPRPTKSGGLLYFVSLHVRFTFFGADGDSVYATAWGEGSDSGDKATNKAMTAAFKYALVQVFAIRGADIADADSSTPEETVAKPKPAAKRPPDTMKPEPTVFVTPPGADRPLDEKRGALEVTIDLICTNGWLTEQQITGSIEKEFGCGIPALTAAQIDGLLDRLTKFVEDQTRAIEELPVA